MTCLWKSCLEMSIDGISFFKISLKWPTSIILQRYKIILLSNSVFVLYTVQCAVDLKGFWQLNFKLKYINSSKYIQSVFDSFGEPRLAVGL